jgi:hypothetical protein
VPSNRTTLPRPQRTRFTPEAIALFVEIESMSRRDRDHWEDDRRPGRRDEYLSKSKKLAALLGLSMEFWGGNDVNDTAKGPCHPPGYPAHEGWYKVRGVRLALLAAAGLEPASARRKLPARHAAPLRMH